jgi:hypothetical protein
VAEQRRSRSASSVYIDNLREQVSVTAVQHSRARDRTLDIELQRDRDFALSVPQNAHCRWGITQCGVQGRD